MTPIRPTDRRSNLADLPLIAALAVAGLLAASCTATNSNGDAGADATGTEGTDADTGQDSSMATQDGGTDDSSDQDSTSPGQDGGTDDGSDANLGIDGGVADAAQEAEAGSSLSAGLVAYYPFDGDALDHSGNANNCTVMGATPTSDRFGQSNSAYLFKATAYMDCGNGPSIDITGDLTLSVWLNADSASLTGSNVLVIGRWLGPTTDTSYGLGIENNDFTSLGCGPNHGALMVVSPDGVGTPVSGELACATSPLSAATWHHMAGVFQAGIRIAVYVDGQALTDNRQSIVTSIHNGTTHLMIGVNQEPPNNVYFQGVLDEMRVYNRALSAAEILALYGGSPDAGTIADAALDRAIGDGASE
jgi:hypothetical protein